MVGGGGCELKEHKETFAKFQVDGRLDPTQKVEAARFAGGLDVSMREREEARMIVFLEEQVAIGKQ